MIFANVVSVFVPLFVHFRCLICSSLSLHEFFAIELAKLAEGQIEERFEWQMDEDGEATEQRMGKVRNIGIWSWSCHKCAWLDELRLSVLPGRYRNVPSWRICNTNDAISCDFPVMKSKRKL